MDQIIAEIKKIPPVTRFLCGSLIGVTSSVILGVVSPYTVLFHSKMITRRLEIWRLYTPFFLGSAGLGLIWDVLILYHVSHELENKSYFLRFSDLAYQLLFVAPTIIAATWPLQPTVFTRPFLLSLVYMYSKLATPGTMTSIMGLVTVPVWYYPYILIAFDFLLGGPRAGALSVAGALVGHMWWWTVWGGDLASQGLLSAYARAPEWLRKLMGESGPRVQPPAAGGRGQGLASGGIHVTAPRRPATAASQSGSSTGYHWGSGQRLGEN